MKCCICGEEFEGYGNNAEPVTEEICCDLCKINVVIPERLKRIKDGEDANDHSSHA